MKTKRFVLDSNILISGLVWPDSIPAKAIEKALNSEVLISENLERELVEVFSRKKFDKFKSQLERENSLRAFINKCILIEVKSVINVCRDIKDNMILELAKDGNAILIVSGDDDLISLNPFEGIQIITARDFLEKF